MNEWFKFAIMFVIGFFISITSYSIGYNASGFDLDVSMDNNTHDAFRIAENMLEDVTVTYNYVMFNESDCIYQLNSGIRHTDGSFEPMSFVICEKNKQKFVQYD